MTTDRRTGPPRDARAPRVARATTTLPVLAASAALAVLATGCTAGSSDPAPTVTVTEPSSPTTGSTSTPSPSTSTTAATASTPYGPGCSSLPNGGVVPDGDLTTVLGAIPQVSAFASAVDSSGLQDRIDSAGNVTVFAPTDDAFSALISSNPRLLLRPADLLDVLSYHVVRSTVDESNIPGTFPTLNNGEDVSITGADGTYVVDGDTAITCGGIRAGNVTVNIVSSVLTPAS